MALISGLDRVLQGTYAAVLSLARAVHCQGRLEGVLSPDGVQKYLEQEKLKVMASAVNIFLQHNWPPPGALSRCVRGEGGPCGAHRCVRGACVPGGWIQTCH